MSLCISFGFGFGFVFGLEYFAIIFITGFTEIVQSRRQFQKNPKLYFL